MVQIGKIPYEAMHAPQQKRRRSRWFQYVSRQVVASSCRFQLCTRTAWISFISSFEETIEQCVLLCHVVGQVFLPLENGPEDSMAKMSLFRRRRGWAPSKSQSWCRYYQWICCHEWSRVIQLMQHYFLLLIRALVVTCVPKQQTA